jgi:hypothetical protein
VNGLKRLPPRRLALFAVVAGALSLPGVAVAQQVSSECQKGIELFKARFSVIQRIQALPKKKTDPVVACSLFTKLGGANARVLTWAKANREWCQIGDDQIKGLEGEATSVASIRGKACGVAAQYTKLKAQAEHARAHNQDDAFSADMHSDPLSQPVKIPPSAL